MRNLILPENYKSPLDLKRTEKAIKLVKDTFQENLSAELKLRRVTAPLFVLKGTKKAPERHKTHSEAFTSASSGNPLSWLSPRSLRVKND